MARPGIVLVMWSASRELRRRYARQPEKNLKLYERFARHVRH